MHPPCANERKEKEKFDKGMMGEFINFYPCCQPLQTIDFFLFPSALRQHFLNFLLNCLLISCLFYLPSSFVVAVLSFDNSNAYTLQQIIRTGYVILTSINKTSEELTTNYFRCHRIWWSGGNALLHGNDSSGSDVHCWCGGDCSGMFS